MRIRGALALLAFFTAGCAATKVESQRPQTTADAVRTHFEQAEKRRMVPLLCEAIRFPTVQGNPAAHEQQKAWLLRVAAELGLSARDAGPVTEIELAGPPGAPVLGLVVHGDVQPVEEGKWTIPPFEGAVKDDYVLGRGAADDKGPLVTALLAMRSLQQSGVKLTHTIRLLVGSDEESANQDFIVYLKTHEPPSFSLVLDSAFPVVVGEKAWNALFVTTDLSERTGGAARPYQVASLDAGLSPSIVPDRAELTLNWQGSTTPDWNSLQTRLKGKSLPPDTRLEFETTGTQLRIRATGRAAHGGVNLEGGRNALVALARALEGELPAGGADDLLAFARLAGRDLGGSGIGLAVEPGDPHAYWGGYSVNVAMVRPPVTAANPGNTANAGNTAKPSGAESRQLVIVARRPPPRTGPELRTHLEKVVSDFNARTGAHLAADGFWADEPLVFDPQAKLVKRLLAAYERATASHEPATVSAGGTYAKRLPRAIAFGMWFPGKPYPGHDVDEKIPVSDLMRSAAVLIEALVDLASSPPLVEPFKP